MTVVGCVTAVGCAVGCGVGCTIGCASGATFEAAGAGWDGAAELDGAVEGMSLLSEGPSVTRDDMLNWDAPADSANAVPIVSEER